MLAMRTASKLCNQTVSRKEDEDFLYATDKVKVLQFGNQVSGGQEAGVPNYHADWGEGSGPSGDR